MPVPNLGGQTRRTSSWCPRATNLRWPMVWILLFSLFGTGCAESLQKTSEDMTMQILNAMFLMTCTVTCTTLMFTLIRAFIVVISCLRGGSWSFRANIRLINQQAVCLFSSVWPCAKVLLLVLWGCKAYPDFGVWTTICCMFVGHDLCDVALRWFQTKTKLMRVILCCRRVGQKRCKQNRKHCMRSKHMCRNTKMHFTYSRYLDSSFQSQCLLPKQANRQMNNQRSDTPPTMFRGGGGGAATTARKRKEKQLLDGLQSLFQQFADAEQPENAKAIAKGKGKGQGKKQTKSKSQNRDATNSDCDYGLLQFRRSHLVRQKSQVNCYLDSRHW